MRRFYSMRTTRVVFDKRMSHGELLVPNDGAAITSSANVEIVLNDDECKDAIVDLLLKGGTNINIGEQLKQWANLRETSRSQGKDLFKIYEAEFHRMQSIFEKKKILYLRYILRYGRTWIVYALKKIKEGKSLGTNH